MRAGFVVQLADIPLLDNNLQNIYNVNTMNNSAVINIRTDIKVKTKAREIAEKLGLSLSAVINAYLKQLIRTKSVTFKLQEEPSEFLIKSLRASQKDIKNGFVSPTFDNIKDADAWLDNPKAKYVNQLRKSI